ncbi:MAG: CBS domain-containing protein [Planctomycetota bacterium]
MFRSSNGLWKAVYNIENLLILIFIAGLAAVFCEALVLTPIHHQVVAAMNPAESIVDSDGVEIQHPMTDAEIIESDRAFFWQAISVGLLVLLVTKMVVCSILVRKSTRKPKAVKRAPQLKHGDRDCIFEKRQDIFHRLGNRLEMLFDDSLRVDSVMTKDVVSVSSADSRDQVVDVMERELLHHVPVLNRSRKLLGIISDGDMERRHGDTAADIMTEPCITVDKDTGIVRAITLMLERRVDCLPITDEGHLCGLLTKTDMLLMLQSMVRTFSLPDIESRLSDILSKEAATQPTLSTLRNQTCESV